MSTKGKGSMTSLSAFAVFKGMKNDKNTPITARRGKGKSASTDSTPTNSSSSITSGNSSKKKQKMDMKQIKKLFKSGGKKRPSFLPDTALNSPILANGKQGTASKNVELRSLRPKGSMANIHYNLPLRATPEKHKSIKPPTGRSATPEIYGDMECSTPPLPPRISRNKNDGVRTSTNICPVAPPPRPCSRSYSPVSQRSPTPSLPPRLGGRAKLPSVSEGELLPVRPAKRRRLSQGSAPPSPGTSEARKSSILSLEGASQRIEPLPIHPAAKTPNQPYMFDSGEEAKKMFECLIHPVLPAKFFNELWEKKPLWVKRHNPDYNEGWFSTGELDKILKQNQLNYGENIDVVAYVNGKRETYNPPGRAHAPVVWDYYQNGCSVRVLNPHTYSKNVWKLLSIVQEHFGCCAGANIYLTPPGTQGFAPHWDDIDAFIIQLEGKKHWKLYSPRSEEETLPRFSSGNFSEEEIGTPLLDAVVEAGDLLYFPRGTIHQGRTLEDSHSLHITVSVCQKNSWGDFLETLLPRALQLATDEDLEFRKSLPRDYLNYMGVAFSDQDCPERKGFLRHVEQLMMKVVSYAPVDASCDQMAKKYIHDSLPPVLTEAEKQCSVHGNGKKWNVERNCTEGAFQLELETSVKIIRKGAIRMVSEDDKVHIYHNLENQRVYHGQDIQYIEIDAEMAPAVEYLLLSYPDYVSVDTFPCETTEEKIEIASIMYDKGMLVTEVPLKPLSDSESDDDYSNETKNTKNKRAKKRKK